MAEIILPTEEQLRAGMVVSMNTGTLDETWFSYEPSYDEGKYGQEGRFRTCFTIVVWRGTFCVSRMKYDTYDEAISHWQDVCTKGAVYIAKKALGLI